MAKTVTVTLTVSSNVRFSQLLRAWLDDGWRLTQEPPPFFREVFDDGLDEERDFLGNPATSKTLGDFLDELDDLCQPGKCVAVDVRNDALDGSVMWKRGDTCEFTFFGSQLCLPEEESKPKRRTDWNRILSTITTPLHAKGIFVLWMTLYEDFV